MRKIADLIEAQLDEFAKAESRDQGKPVLLAKKVDIPRACLNFRFFASTIISSSAENQYVHVLTTAVMLAFMC